MQSQQDIKTLWIGDIEPWMDENFLSQLFSHTQQLLGVKIIRDKMSGQPSGYGFLDFATHELANHILTNYNGKQIPNTNKVFRLNWGVYGGANKGVGVAQIQRPIQPPVNQGYNQQQQMQSQQEHSIYVGDLDPTVTDLLLLEFYAQKYPSTTSAKVIIDSMTRFSKGYGFVKFSNRDEGIRAQQETNGAILKGRHIKTNNAVMKSAVGMSQDQGYYQQVYNQMGQQPLPPQNQVPVNAQQQPQAQIYQQPVIQNYQNQNIPQTQDIQTDIQTNQINQQNLNQQPNGQLQMVKIPPQINFLNGNQQNSSDQKNPVVSEYLQYNHDFISIKNQQKNIFSNH